MHSRDSVWEWNWANVCVRIPLTKPYGRVFAFYSEGARTFRVLLVKVSKHTLLLDCSSVPTFSHHLPGKAGQKKGRTLLKVIHIHCSVFIYLNTLNSATPEALKQAKHEYLLPVTATFCFFFFSFCRRWPDETT